MAGWPGGHKREACPESEVCSRSRMFDTLEKVFLGLCVCMPEMLRERASADRREVVREGGML
jgi:hypothetical protein